jgi:hypothetical protein
MMLEPRLHLAPLVRDAAALLTMALLAMAFLAVLAMAGLSLLVLADSLVPMPRIGERLVEAAAERRFGDARGIERTFGFEQNHFSDCIALSVAASGLDGEPSFSIRSRAVLWRPPANICDTAVSAVTDRNGVAWFDYSRYWHGYRIVLFPLVAAAGIAGARAATGAILFLSLATLFVRLIPVAGPIGSLCGFVVLLVLSGIPFAYETPTHAISLSILLGSGALFIGLSWRLPAQRILFAAFGIGAVYNFFDFLYNPGALALLLGGLLVLVKARERPPGRGEAVLAGLVVVAALAGYGGFWLAKWLIALPFYLAGIADAPIRTGDFGRWAAGGETGFVPLMASAKMIAITLAGGRRLAVGLAVIVLGAFAACRRPERAQALFAALAVPIAGGFLAIEGAAGHSLAHAPFTFRIGAFALALLACAAGSCFDTPFRPPQGP